VRNPAGDDAATGAGGDSRLRASDTDREQVIDVLKTAFVQGRVSKEELDLRVGLALRSQTHGDLDAVTAGIPPGLAAAQPRRVPVPIPNRAPARSEAGRRDRAVVAMASFAMLAWVVALFAGPDAALPFVIGTGSALASLFLLAAQMVGARNQSRPGPRPPKQRADNPGSEAAHRAAPAGSAGQLRSRSNPRWQAQVARPLRPFRTHVLRAA
jgi:hypothetical protein